MKDPLITQVSPLPKGQTDMSRDKILAVKFYCGQTFLSRVFFAKLKDTQ